MVSSSSPSHHLSHFIKSQVSVLWSSVVLVVGCPEPCLDSFMPIRPVVIMRTAHAQSAISRRSESSSTPRPTRTFTLHISSSIRSPFKTSSSTAQSRAHVHSLPRSRVNIVQPALLIIYRTTCATDHHTCHHSLSYLVRTRVPKLRRRLSLAWTTRKIPMRFHS